MAASPTLHLRAEEVAVVLKSEEANHLNWEGLVPVCSWCGKIRTPEGEWLTLEAFFMKYFGKDCTHGMCQGCRDRHYQDFS